MERKSGADAAGRVRRLRDTLSLGATTPTSPVASAFGSDGLPQGVPVQGLDNLLADLAAGKLYGIYMLQARPPPGTRPGQTLLEVEYGLGKEGKPVLKARLAGAAGGANAETTKALKAFKDELQSTSKRVVQHVEAVRRVTVMGGLTLEYTADKDGLYLSGVRGLATSAGPGEEAMAQSAMFSSASVAAAAAAVRAGAAAAGAAPSQPASPAAAAMLGAGSLGWEAILYAQQQQQQQQAAAAGGGGGDAAPPAPFPSAASQASAALLNALPPRLFPLPPGGASPAYNPTMGTPLPMFDLATPLMQQNSSSSSSFALLAAGGWGNPAAYQAMQAQLLAQQAQLSHTQAQLAAALAAKDAANASATAATIAAAKASKSVSPPRERAGAASGSEGAAVLSPRGGARRRGLAQGGDGSGGGGVTHIIEGEETKESKEGDSTQQQQQQQQHSAVLTSPYKASMLAGRGRGGGGAGAAEGGSSSSTGVGDAAAATKSATVAALQRQVKELTSTLDTTRKELGKLQAMHAPDTQSIAVLRAAGRFAYSEEPLPPAEAGRGALVTLVQRLQSRWREALDLAEEVKRSLYVDKAAMAAMLLETHGKELGALKEGKRETEAALAGARAQLKATTEELVAAQRREAQAGERVAKQAGEIKRLTEDLKGVLAAGGGGGGGAPAGGATRGGAPPAAAAPGEGRLKRGGGPASGSAATLPSPKLKAAGAAAAQQQQQQQQALSAHRSAAVDILSSGLSVEDSGALSEGFSLSSPTEAPPGATAGTLGLAAAPPAAASAAAATAAAAAAVPTGALASMQITIRQLTMEVELLRSNLAVEAQSRTEAAAREASSGDEFRREVSRLQAHINALQAGERERVAGGIVRDVAAEPTSAGGGSASSSSSSSAPPLALLPRGPLQPAAKNARGGGPAGHPCHGAR